MTGRRNASASHRIFLSLVIVLAAGGCNPSGEPRAWTLTPLVARPEDPDSTHIADQIDFMPSASPNGDLVLFTSARSGAERLYLMNADGTNQRILYDGPGTQKQGSWSPDGTKIAYLQLQDDRQFLATMHVDGSNATTLVDVGNGWTTPSWSPDGTRIMYHAPGTFGADDVWVIDAQGGEPDLVIGSAREEWHPAWSPDGTEVVFTSRRDGPDFDIYIADLNGGAWRRVTDNAVNDFTPSWSPDGSQIVFQSPRGNRWTIVTVRPDGSAERQLTQYPMQWDPVWSHDGTEIFFNSARDGRRGIYVMYADGSNPRKLTNTDPGDFVRVVREAGVEEAARIFRNAHTLNPSAVFFYEREVQYLGLHYLEMGDLPRAVLLFEVNVEAYPDSKSAHMDLGRARLAAGETSRAIESYRRALEIDPDDERTSRLVTRLTASPS